MTPIAFGNQTIFLARAGGGRLALRRRKTHGFASLPHDRFAFIVCNRLTPKDHFRHSPVMTIRVKHAAFKLVKSYVFRYFSGNLNG